MQLMNVIRKGVLVPFPPAAKKNGIIALSPLLNCRQSGEIYCWRIKMTTPVFCVDMDGTLLDEQGRIHPLDREVLQNSKEVLVIPTTGRPLHSIQSRFSTNDLWQNQKIPLPMVLDNGCSLYRPGEEMFRYTAFEPGLQDTLFEIIWQHPDLSFAFVHPQEVHYPWLPSDFARPYFDSFDFKMRPFTEQSRQIPFARVTMISEEPGQIERFVNAVRDLPVEHTSSMPALCELMPAGRHKAQGIEELLEALEIKDAYICAAGDGGNDVEIFELSQRSFAPNTSPEEIQKQADQVIEVEKTGLLGPMIEWARRL
jgi:5-amino-6-(5-phospho-D-ribitylamino)uracil phosphatase